MICEACGVDLLEEQHKGWCPGREPMPAPDTTLCRNCGRGQSACEYCHTLPWDISRDVICDCGLDDFGRHLMDCLDRTGKKFVVVANYGSEELLDDTCSDCFLDKDSCVFCQYPNSDIRDGICPNCNFKPRQVAGLPMPLGEARFSTWHVVEKDGSSMCCACQHRHAYEAGVLCL